MRDSQEFHKRFMRDSRGIRLVFADLGVGNSFGSVLLGSWENACRHH